jgi:hypothetical protein
MLRDRLRRLVAAVRAAVDEAAFDCSEGSSRVTELRPGVTTVRMLDCAAAKRERAHAAHPSHRRITPAWERAPKAGT